MANIPTSVLYQMGWSAAVVIVLFILRWTLARLIRRGKETLNPTERRLVGFTRSVTVLLMIIALVIIWLPNLSNFALSIAAFGVAIVFATRELILCFSGALWRAITTPFEEGDWVEIGHERGEVLELNLLSTHLAELDEVGGKFTGRTLVLPNSMLLSTTIRNENLWRRFTHHKFTLTANYGVDIANFDDALSKKVEAHCADFRPVAERYMNAIRRRVGVDLIPAEPHVDIGTSIEGRPEMTVHLFCPVDQCEPLQQAITHDFFAMLRDKRNYFTPQ